MKKPCEMENGTREEIELVPMKQKENILHDELIQLLDGDESDIGDLQAKAGMDSAFTSTSVQADILKDACDFLPKDETIPSYIEEFEKDAQDDIIVLGSLSQKQDFKCEADYYQTGRKLFYRRSNHAFKKTESQLLNTANAHKEKILAKLGNISEMNNESNGAAGLCWKGGWSDRPQPIEIVLKCLRGVKDKIPKGHYVLKTSLLSHPGGHNLHWSKVKDNLWAETTLPVYHKGRFFDVEMAVNHAVHTLLPTEKKIKSGMTLLLELYLLHGKDTYIDRAVGWGIFPLCDNNLNVLEGKFKCPFLRGHYDSRIDRFSKFEDLIMTDLDNWLCNLYFQVVKLPLSTSEQYNTFVQLPQEFLSYSNHDDKKIGTEGDVQNPSRQKDCKKSIQSQNAHSSLFFSYSHGQPLASFKKEPNVHKEFLPSTMSSMETQLNAMKGKERNLLKESKTKLQQTSLTQILQVEETSEESTVKHIRRKICQRGVPRNKVVPYVDKQSSALTSKEDFDLDKKKEEKDSPAKHFQSMPTIETSEEKQTDKCSTSTSYMDELEKHRFSVCQPTKEMHVYRRMVKRATFVIWAVFSELDMGQWRSHDFWSIMFMMALMWFIRLYLHYCAQWLFLQAISIPVFTFAFYPHTVELTYQHSLMHTREELFMVVVGPMSLNVSMLLIILLRWSCQILFHSFPTILSKFIIALGLWTVLDPLAVFIVDSFLGRLSYSVDKPIADAAKLYWFFIRIEQSGTPGILITLLIYTMIFIISSSVLYLYLLRIHKESWILDVFQRITCDEGVCHVPYDLEISNQELSHIVRKAEQWRGINGERRKVTVYDYIWNKETTKKLSTSDIQHLEHYSSKGDEDSSKDITTHVMIYTIHLRGYRDLYRQFLRLPDGAIVEIFGEFSGISLLPSDVNNTVEDHVKQIYSPMCDAMDIRERKKSTADN